MSSSSTIETLFSGISDPSDYPPHNGLALGPNNIVMAEGSKIEWTNLSGGAATTQSVYQFFQPLGATATNSLFDPRCVYDSVNQRYIVTVDNIGFNGTISNIDIAVSKDSNPNDGWYFASLNTAITINGQLTDSDQPTVSVDGKNIYVTAPQYNASGGGWQGTECWVIGDTAGSGGGIYNGGALTVVGNQVASPSQNIFRVVAGGNGKSYYAAAYSNGSQTILTVQTYDLATNSFGPTSTFALGNSDQGGGGANFTAQQQGTSLLLDAGDTNIQNLAYANGFLYGVSEVKPAGSSVPAVHWFKIDVSNPGSPTLVAQGDISGAAIGANVAIFDGSIAVDGAGDVLINFTASGPNLYPSDYYVYQGADNSTTGFSAPILYQASTGFFNSGNGATTQRWGDNSTAIVDPNNPRSFWISGEYVANGWWQTSVARVAIQNLAAAGPTVASILASGPGITNGTGDLDADKTVTLTVNFSAAVTVNTAGGAPTLTLNDRGSATYTGGSGTSALTFSYTVLAGQNTADLVVSSFALNGATVQDTAGNAADLSGATNYNPAGILQIDTTAPVPVITQEPPSVTSSSTAFFQFGTSNTETNGVAYAYELDGATTWTPVSGNTLSLSGLTNGSHTIQVQGTDGAGNVSATPTSYGWTVNPAASSTITTSFSGISDPSDDPPDNGLAVGPNNIVMAEGQRVEWTDLSGGAATLLSGYTFFSVSTGSVKDSSCNYDSVNHRYIVTSENLISSSSVLTSNLRIAVSKDTNPNDGWNFASVNSAITINNIATASDEPTVSVDGTNIYIAAPQYNATGSGFQGSQLWVIGDTAGAGGGIYNGGTPTIVATQTTIPSQGIFRVVAGNNGKAYYASIYNPGSQSTVALQVYDAATNTFAPVSTIALGNIDQGNGGTYFTAQQQGTSVLLNVNDTRLANLAYMNGFLYGVSEMMPFGSSVAQVHWFKLDVSNPSSPTLVAQGNISGDAIGAGVATFDGSIAVDAAGDVLINFTASGPNMYPADYYVVHGANDPTASFGAPVLYKSSASFFVDPAVGSGPQRWGANSSAIVDPNNPNGFWVSSEYIANGWWQTSVAEVAIQNPTAGPTVSSIVASGPGITNGTGDLNAGKVVTLTVNFSAAVTVNTAGGTPTLSLNDGGSATYTGGSGTSAFAFSYTVLAGQNTPDLVVSSFALNGATIQDAAGNAANLSGATNYNPAGILQIDTTPPAVTESLVSDTGSSSTDKITSNDALTGSGDANAVVQFTVDGAAISGTATADGTGKWSFTPTGLVDGQHTIVASETDAAGNSGTASLTFTLDQDASEQSSLSLNVADTLIGSAGAATVHFTIGGLEPDDGGTVTFSDGMHQVTVNVSVAQTNYMANLTTLGDGPITSKLSLNNDVAGNTFVPISGNTVILDQDTNEHSTVTLSGLTGGNAVEGTAVSATVTDEDLPSSGITYTWQVSHDGGTSWTTVGTNSNSYTPSETDEGGQLHVLTSFVDLAGNTETGSASIGTVTDVPPTLTIGSLALSVNEGATIGLPITVATSDSDDVVSVKITGLPSGATLTDGFDAQTFNGGAPITLSAAEVNSGLTLHAGEDGSATLTVTATNAEGAGATTAPQSISLTVNPVAETPTLTIGSASLTVVPGGSVTMGISVTPADSDDNVSVTISGLPKFETITAGDGSAVAKRNGSYTFTAADVNSGLTLHSSYQGKGNRVNTLTVTATNTTFGETATSPPGTITVTDPPATISNTNPDRTPLKQALEPSPNPAPFNQFSALLDQFSAADFHNDRNGAGQMMASSPLQSGLEDLSFLTRPHHAAFCHSDLVSS